APDLGGKGARPRLCSTPRGVTAFCTTGGRGLRAVPRVLNASRRHCLLHVAAQLLERAELVCSTPRGVTAFCTPERSFTTWPCSCAHRLAAPLPSARRRAAGGGSMSSRAHRLAASLPSAPRRKRRTTTR